MVKSFREPNSSISRDKKDKLLEVMDKSKISLLRAAQLLDIPYTTAKQILFIFNTPRKSIAMASRSPSALSLNSHQVSTPPEIKKSTTQAEPDKVEKVEKHVEQKVRKEIAKKSRNPHSNNSPHHSPHHSNSKTKHS